MLARSKRLFKSNGNNRQVAGLLQGHEEIYKVMIRGPRVHGVEVRELGGRGLEGRGLGDRGEA